MLKISGLVKKYGEKCAVDKLNLEIADGEIYAFIGHNGAGKTTTIKACMGILSFDEGDIFVDGLSIMDEPLECKRKMAYIPDNPDLYDFMTGISYLNFVADVYGISTEEREKKISEISEKLGLKQNLADRIGSYSHGMKQKLAVIAAWLHSPKLIIMDEPFVGLDPKASHTLKEMMREHCNKGGSIFFSTHVLDVAERMCDSVAIIKEGRLVTSGRMDEVRGDSSLEAVFLELEGGNDD